MHFHAGANNRKWCCEHFDAGVAFTVRGSVIAYHNGFEGGELESLLDKMIVQPQKINTYLDKEENVYLKKEYYVLIRDVLIYYDRFSDRDSIETDQRKIDVFQERFSELEHFVQLRAESQAKLRYLKGMLLGVGSGMLLYILVILVWSFFQEKWEGLYNVFMFGFLGGGFGALTSVVTRIGIDDWYVNPFSDKNLVWITGGTKFLGGALTGIALVLLFRSFYEWSGDKLIYMTLSISFLGGYVERLGNDIFNSVGYLFRKRLSGAEKQLSTPSLNRNKAPDVPDSAS